VIKVLYGLKRAKTRGRLAGGRLKDRRNKAGGGRSEAGIVYVCRVIRACGMKKSAREGAKAARTPCGSSGSGGGGRGVTAEKM